MNSIAFPDDEPLIGEARDLVKQSSDLKVNDPASKSAGAALLAKVRLCAKRIKERVAVLKEPFQKEIKKLDEAARTPLAELLDADTKLNRSLIAYTNEVNRQAQIEQQKLMDRYEKKVAKAEAKAIANNTPLPLIAPPPVIQQEPTSVHTDDAMVTIKKGPKAWRIRRTAEELGCSVTVNKKGEPEVAYDELTARRAFDLGLNIPLDLFILNTAQVGKIVRAGGTIQGIESYDTQITSVKEG